MRIEIDLDGAVVRAIERYYHHACEKHPYFCDSLLSRTIKKRELDALLADLRGDLRRGSENGCVAATDVIDCKLCELESALAWGDTAHAIDAAYAAISVLLRVLDVLEGRQELGKTDKGKVAR